MAKDFQIDAYRKEKDLLVCLKGRLILDSCQEAKMRLSSLINPNIDHVYIQLSELDFLDSAGLGVFVSLKQIVNRNRARLSILSPSPRVEEVFRVSKLDTIFELRTGSEAEVLSTSLRKPEYCLWSDAQDGPHSNLTEAHFTGMDANLLTGYNEAEASAPDTASLIKQWCDAAVQHIKLGKYPEAIDEYQRVLSKDPENLTALNNLGIVYEKRPIWYMQAKDTWERVLEISAKRKDPKHGERARKHLDSLAKITGS